MKNIFLFLSLILNFGLFSQKENSAIDTISKILEKNDTITSEIYLKKQISIFFDSVYYFSSPLLNTEKNKINLIPSFNENFSLSLNEYKSINTSFLSIYQPITLIQYTAGSGEYQHLQLNHYQKFLKKLHFGSNYNRIKATGFYQNQKTISDELSIQINSDDSKKYIFKANYLFNKMIRFENGGIKSDSVFEASSVLNPMTLDVNLFSAFNTFLSHRADMENTYRNKKLIVYNRLSYRFSYRKYTDDPASGFYEFILFDSTKTDDRYEINSFESSTGFKYKIQNLWMEFFIGNENTYYKTVYYDTSYFNNSVNIDLEYKNKLSLKGAYFITGYQKNNYIFSINYINYISSISTKIKFNSSVKQNNPEIELQKLYSNNYEWFINFNTQSQNFNSLIISNKLGILTFLNTNYLNYIFINADLIPEQKDDLFSILSIIYNYNKENNKIILKSSITYQVNLNGEEVYRVPAFIGFAELGFKMHLKALKIVSGMNVQYFSSYFANDFNPALNNFSIQNEKKTGNYPYASLFLKSEVGNVHFKFCVNHVNDGLMKTPYYSTLHYPNSPRNYQLSLSWLFKD